MVNNRALRVVRVVLSEDSSRDLEWMTRSIEPLIAPHGNREAFPHQCLFRTRLLTAQFTFITFVLRVHRNRNESAIRVAQKVSAPNGLS
jgi:hypothetical protein